MKRQIAILGSTGSIGTQALEVIEEHSDLYEVYCLTANNKVELLAEQAHKFKPAAIVIANEARYDELKQLMSDMPDVPRRDCRGRSHRHGTHRYGGFRRTESYHPRHQGT